MGAKLGRLHEVKYDWSIDELADAHEYMAIKAEAEAHALDVQRQLAAGKRG